MLFYFSILVILSQNLCSEMAQVHDNRFGSMEDPIDCVQTDFSAEIHRVKGMLSRMEASMGAY